MTFCPTCGLDPCGNPQFCALCRAADARKARNPSDWRRDGAPQPTVEALMWGLRSRGTKALEEAATKRRLSELSEQQLHQICGRLQRLKPHIAPAWPAEQIVTLVDAWNGCHG